LDLNRVVGKSLRVGVLVGAFLSLLGLVLWALRGFGSVDPAPASSLLDVFRSGLSGDVAGIVYLGVAVLVATPVFRVAISTVHFGLEMDWKYVGITVLVLGMLVYALVAQAVE